MASVPGIATSFIASAFSLSAGMCRKPRSQGAGPSRASQGPILPWCSAVNEQLQWVPEVFHFYTSLPSSARHAKGPGPPGPHAEERSVSLCSRPSSFCI